MSVIPCEQNALLRQQIEQFSEVLKTQAHTLGNHGLDEQEFYNSGLFRGAVERLRGQFSSNMREKRELVQNILNHAEDSGGIRGWEATEMANRYDYLVQLPTGRTAAIALTGCLDGNNTTIFERPNDAQEFVIWSVCTNPGADPRRNAWSGIHTRLSAEIVSRAQSVDGLIIWDMVCGTIGRPCPKLAAESSPRLNNVGAFRLPPPCIYVFPRNAPSVQQPSAIAQGLEEVELLNAFNNVFRGRQEEVYYVDFEISGVDTDIMRKTRVRRNGTVQRESDLTPIRRT